MTAVTMRKSTDVRSRIEPDLKDRASEVLAACGLNLSDAIRPFLHQVVAQQGPPFEVKAPNAATVAAMREARSTRKAKFRSAQGLSQGHWAWAQVESPWSMSSSAATNAPSSTVNDPAEE